MPNHTQRSQNGEGEGAEGVSSVEPQPALANGLNANESAGEKTDEKASVNGDGNADARPMRRKAYERQKRELQIELLKVQRWIQDHQQKIAVFFEGRDAAGNGGAIKPFMEHLNPRSARVVALQKPTDRERSQWYFQRYITELPAAGEIHFFDRSWYNRAGVERIMGFCTPEEYLEFIRQAPEVERMLVRSGLHFFKYWFSVSQREQLERFEACSEDPLRQWKLSTLDHASITRWDQYTEAQDVMFFHTDTADAPWVVIDASDKRRARIACMQHFLLHLDYPGKDLSVVTGPDPELVGSPQQQLPSSP